MGLIHHGIPEEYVQSLRKAFGIKCFVETGTLHGVTTKWAAERFERVITIELSEELHRRATATLAPYPNVSALHGDTRHHLARIAPTLSSSIIWLDAHYSAGPTAGTEDECPLLGEIEALAPCWNECFVIVDDARYFLAPPPPPHDAAQWPSIVQVVNALERGPDRFVATFEDVIVSLPGEAKKVTLEYIQKGGALNERVVGYAREDSLTDLLGKLGGRLRSRLTGAGR